MTGAVFKEVVLVNARISGLIDGLTVNDVQVGPLIGAELDSFDFDLDSQAFVLKWNEGWPADRTGPVLGFQVASSEAVDDLYLELTNAGYDGQQRPWDGFMGARYAVVADPDGNAVGLMGPIDPGRKRMPPDPEG